MVFSFYLYKYPYKFIWHIKNSFGKTIDFAFYCADPLDYEMFLPIAKYLPEFTVIARDSKTKKYLTEKGIKSVRMPAFPQVVIMARQTPYKFPVKEIIKFGFDHGLYQFKRWTSAENYNGFDMYFVSSSNQVKIAESRGIKSTKAIGYPKLDSAFNGEYNNQFLEKFKKLHNIDSNKKTIIFTTTWNVAGLSAINKWVDKLEELTAKYNVLVTVHTWTEQKHIQKLNSTKDIIFINDYDVTPFLMISDLLIGDYSSIIGEFCAFNKPIITFEVPESDRTIPDIIKMIMDISIQINSFDQLPKAIEESIANPNEKVEERRKANKILFDDLDGKAGYRAANFINEFLKSHS